MQHTIAKLREAKTISVIIPNYNGCVLLPQILPPLFEALHNTKLSYEVIISDDCSTDDSVTFIETNFPQIKLIKNEVNSGFSPTINKGIFLAKYDLILMLNSDVKLTPNYFEHLLPYFDDIDTFGVMGRIIGWENDNIQDGGKYPSFHGVKMKTSGNYIPLNSNIGDRLFSMYLSGANALVSKSKLLELGGFDELFAPFYIEDFELSLRAWRLGWKCYYEHHAICRHQTSTTIKSSSSKNNIKKIYYRNKMFLHAIHLDKVKLTLWYLQLIPEALMHFFTGNWWVFVSVKMFFLSRNGVKKSRSKFETLAKNKKRRLSVNAVVNTVLISFKNIKISTFK